MNISSFVIPASLIFCGALMMFGKASFDDFTRGAVNGMKTVASLLPTLVALVCALTMLEQAVLLL